MNIASTSAPVIGSSSRFNAVLVEGEKGLGLESTLREQGCSVRRLSSINGADIDGTDVVVISASGFVDGEVLELAQRAMLASSVVIATDNTDLAIKASRLGALAVSGSSLDLASAQIGQALAVADLKRRSSRSSASPSSFPSSPNSGVVQRRSTPLPKEATLEALDALVEAAEGLVPMHKFQRVYVDYALRRFGGNKVHTAAALGIDRRTIQRWARARADVSPTTGVARDLTNVAS
ncbi:MAG: hypothetical protein JWP97_5199 [Labilithrix sp.]|nr:hypothetical protein [Labilithrix sp.]